MVAHQQGVGKGQEVAVAEQMSGCPLIHHASGMRRGAVGHGWRHNRSRCIVCFVVRGGGCPRAEADAVAQLYVVDELEG